MRFDLVMNARVFVVCLLSAAASALPLKDNQYEFSVNVPPGFIRLPQEEAPGALHAFRREPAPEGSFAVLIFRGIPRTLSQTEKLDPEHLVSEASAKKGAAATGATVRKFEYRQVTWKGFPLEVTVIRADTPSGASVSSSTMLPLASGTLLVQLAGSESDEARLISEFDAVIASVGAETNWSNGLTINDVQRLSERAGLLIGTLGTVGVMAWLLRRRKARP